MTGSVFSKLTQPYFGISGGYRVASVAFAPLVKAEKESAWVKWANQGWIKESARLKENLPGHEGPLHNTIQDYENNSYDRKLLGPKPATPSFRIGKTGDRCLKRLSLVKCLLPCGR